MAIDAYTGKPGHGKSYGVVQHVIIPSLKQNRHVVTNIPLQVDMLLEDFGGYVTQLPDDWHTRPDLNDLAPPGCVLILDELWRRWPAGLKANAVSHEDKALLAEHRHRVDKNGKSMRIVLVTQDLSQVAAFAVALIEQTYRVVKKTKTTYRVDIYSGGVKGDRPPKTQLQRQSFGKFSADVHRYYQSATQSQTGEVGDESKADRRGNVFASPSFWALMLLVVVSLLGGSIGLYSYFSPVINGPSKPVQSSLVNPPPPEPVQPQPRASVAERAVKTVVPLPSDGNLPPSAVWRVAGFAGCSVTDDSGVIRPCGPSVSGSGSLSRTSSVILAGDANQRRIMPLSSCRWIERDLYLLCDVDGERVTPWTGRGAVTQVVDSVATDGGRQSVPESERSDRPGTDAGSQKPAKTSTTVVVVPYEPEPRKFL